MNNNINRFQGQGHRLGGNQTLQQVRARQVGQQAAQVVANGPQANAQVAAQVAANAPQANAQVAVQQPLPAAQGLQVLAQQNLQAMQVNNPVQNNNQRMANFVQNVTREYGPLPENVEKLTNPQMDHFVFDRNRLQDVGNLVTYLKDVVKNANITSAQCFNALPNEDDSTLIDNHLLSRQSQNDGSIRFCLDEDDEVYVDEHDVEYFSDEPGRKVTINLAHNDRYEILNGLVSYRKSPIGSKLSVEDSYKIPIVIVENTRSAKRFFENEKINGWTRYKQYLEFNDQGILTSHLIQDTCQDRSYDVLNNRVAVDGMDILGPGNQVNTTGTVNDLITHHNEVMSQLHRNEAGIIDDDRQVVDLTAAGNRAEAIDGDWNNGYIYYNEDGNKKYEYIKNKDGQGNNQIRTYHQDIEVPSFDIVTQSNLEDLESATYTYNRYDRRGDTMVQNEQIINNNVADTIVFNLTPKIVTRNIMQLAANANNFQVNYNGTNINIPSNQVNTTGTMNDLITHHNEVMGQLHRNVAGIIDDDVPIIDLTADGNRAEAINGDWNNGYIYYNEDGNKKYEYIKNMDGQGNNQIITYHEDIEKPSFDIVTQSNLEDLGSATYTYNRYDRRGDTMVQNEQIVNNDVADTIAFNITPIINQLATNDDRETVAEINALLLKAYNPQKVLNTIESIR